MRDDLSRKCSIDHVQLVQHDLNSLEALLTKYYLVFRFKGERWKVLTEASCSLTKPSLFFQRQRRTVQHCSYRSSPNNFYRLIAGSPLSGEPWQGNTAERNGPGARELRAGLFSLKRIMLVAQSASAMPGFGGLTQETTAASGLMNMSLDEHKSYPHIRQSRCSGDQLSPSLIHSSIY